MNNTVTSIEIKVIGGRTLSTTAVLQNNYFASGPSLPYNIAEAASIEVNDNIYVIGGKGKESTNTYTIRIMDVGYGRFIGACKQFVESKLRLYSQPTSGQYFCSS